jgi:hypothetical protein
VVGVPKREGHSDGDAETARLQFPVDVCYDVFAARSGRPRLFVADAHRILALYYQVLGRENK